MAKYDSQAKLLNPANLKSSPLTTSLIRLESYLDHEERLVGRWLTAPYRGEKNQKTQVAKKYSSYNSLIREPVLLHSAFGQLVLHLQIQQHLFKVSRSPLTQANKLSSPCVQRQMAPLNFLNTHC